MSDSPALKALRYAEDNLGVNLIFEDAVNRKEKMDDVLTELSTLRDKKRDLQSRLNDKEMEVAADEWGKHPDMAAARMEKHVKIAYSNDGEIRGYREELNQISGQIEGLEYDKEILDTEIKIAVARMHELGGYLQYLAVIKEASIAREAKQTSTEGNPW